MSKRTKLMIAAALSIAGCALWAMSAGAASAEQWRESHPRRAEVNARLGHQQARIHQEVREGELTRAQGARLSVQERAIRQQERRMASVQGGHITAAQQRTLNREETAVGGEIPR